MIDMGFLKIIEEVESSIESRYIPGAIRWADETFDNAWSKAIDSFQSALDSGDVAAMMRESEIYKSTCLKLIGGYRQHHGDKRASSIFVRLENEQKAKANQRGKER